MIFAVDHIVFASTGAERSALGEGLERAGARREDFTLEFPDDGVASDSWSLADGNYLEFVVEEVGRRGPELWFDAPTRVIGIGFASDDFAADTAWAEEEDRWEMDEELVLSGGRRYRIHAAGPHEHASQFYVFVMDRPDGRLDFAADPAAPRLVGIDLSGAGAVGFGTSVAGWLGRPLADGAFRVGGCELRLGAGEAPGVHASLRLEGGAEPAELELADGSIGVRA
jgi:hypothetical protein